MNRLANIATRQTSNRVRTLVFAACLAAVGVVSIASVRTCVAASHVPATSHVASLR
jgi:hypothetical protein